MTKIKDLGEWAESEFATQCAAAGVTRNKAVQDRTGWDYLVEFPARRLAALPADLQPAGRSARVQVKSKENGKATVPLKLTNALRFAKDPLPCFVVLFRATKGAPPVRVFAKHFWEAEIEHTLRRAREAGETDDAALARQSLTVSFAPEDEHTGDLLAWMEATVHSFGPDYGERKTAFERTVGMADGFIHGSISVLQEDLQALADHQIGLLPTAPISKVTVKHARFGIDAAQPLFSGKPHMVHMRVHPRACRLRLRGADGSILWLDGQLYRPAVPDLPHEMAKTRIVGDFLEIVAPDGASQVVATIRSDAEAQRSLTAMAALVQLLTLAAQGPVDIRVSIEDRVVLGLETHVQTIADPQWLADMANIVRCLQLVVDGVEPEGLTLSFRDIMQVFNEIVDFNSLVTGGNLEANITLADPPAGPLTARSLLAYDFVEIGGWTYMAVVSRPITELSVDERTISIQCGPPAVLEGMVRKGPAEARITELHNRFTLALQLGGKEVLMAFEGDWRAMLKGLIEEA